MRLRPAFGNGAQRSSQTRQNLPLDRSQLKREKVQLQAWYHILDDDLASKHESLLKLEHKNTKLQDMISLLKLRTSSLRLRFTNRDEWNQLLDNSLTIRRQPTAPLPRNYVTASMKTILRSRTQKDPRQSVFAKRESLRQVRKWVLLDRLATCLGVGWHGCEGDSFPQGSNSFNLIILQEYVQ